MEADMEDPSVTLRVPSCPEHKRRLGASVPAWCPQPAVQSGGWEQTHFLSICDQAALRVGTSRPHSRQRAEGEEEREKEI